MTSDTVDVDTFMYNFSLITGTLLSRSLGLSLLRLIWRHVEVYSVLNRFESRSLVLRICCTEVSCLTGPAHMALDLRDGGSLQTSALLVAWITLKASVSSQSSPI